MNQKITFPKPQNFIAKLSQREDLSSHYKSFRFELVKPLTIENYAGQFISILIPPQKGAEGKQTPVRRSYSMTDRPDINSSFELCVSQINPGVGVNYLNALELGEKVEVMGPLGMFVVSPDTTAEKELLFIATGAGIAPIKSMLTDLLQLRGDTRPITLYWGVRSENEFFWLEDFQTWERAFPNFHFKPIVSQPSPDWTLSRGRVTDLLVADGLSAQTGVYLCGNPAMVQSVLELLTNNFQHLAQLIHREQFN